MLFRRFQKRLAIIITPPRPPVGVCVSYVSSTCLFAPVTSLFSPPFLSRCLAVACLPTSLLLQFLSFLSAPPDFPTLTLGLGVFFPTLLELPSTTLYSAVHSFSLCPRSDTCLPLTFPSLAQVCPGDDVYLVSEPEQRYLRLDVTNASSAHGFESGAPVAGVSIVASFHSTVWSILPYRNGDQAEQSTPMLSGGDVVQLRVRRGQHLLAADDPRGSVADVVRAADFAALTAVYASEQIATLAPASACREARTMWRLELLQREWAGGTLAWDQPFRLRSLTSGNCLGLAPANATAPLRPVVTVPVDAANEATAPTAATLGAHATLGNTTHSTHDLSVFALRPAAGGVRSDFILIGDSPAVIYHYHSGAVVDLQRQYGIEGGAPSASNPGYSPLGSLAQNTRPRSAHASRTAAGGDFQLSPDASPTTSDNDNDGDGGARGRERRRDSQRRRATDAATGAAAHERDHDHDTEAVHVAGAGAAAAAAAAAASTPTTAGSTTPLTSYIVARADSHVDDGFIFSRVEEARVHDMQLLLAIRRRLCVFLEALRRTPGLPPAEVVQAGIHEALELFAHLKMFLEGGALRSSGGGRFGGSSRRELGTPASSAAASAASGGQSEDERVGAASLGEDDETDRSIVKRRQAAFGAEALIDVCSALVDIPLLELRMVQLPDLINHRTALAGSLARLFRSCHNVLSVAVRGNRQNCLYYAEKGRYVLGLFG